MSGKRRGDQSSTAKPNTPLQRNDDDGKDVVALLADSSISITGTLNSNGKVDIDDDNGQPMTMSKIPMMNVDPLRLSFTRQPITFTSADLVQEMMWSTGGKGYTELFLEGYLPGGADRWSVRVDSDAFSSSRSSSSSIPSVSPSSSIDQDDYQGATGQRTVFSVSPVRAGTNVTAASFSPATSRPRTNSGIAANGSQYGLGSDESTANLTDDDDDCENEVDDGSTILPMHTLWENMWGRTQQPPPIPSHMQTGDDDLGVTEEEDIAQLAAKCSVPVDLDENTFIIDCPEHLRSVHDLAMIPLQRRRFDTALDIFEKLLRGLETANSRRYEHLLGCTHHNIGIINSCQGRHGEALEHFHRAVQIRVECLPLNHPDTAVSLIRSGTAAMAVENYTKAIVFLGSALNMWPTEDMTRAKILNNIGVANFMQGEHNKSIVAFTSALEIQRSWLDCDVRRESLVYDAAVTMTNMGRVYVTKGDFDLAYIVYEEACLLQTTTFRKDHYVILESLTNMVLAKTKNKEYEKAIQISKSLLRSQESRFGARSKEAMETRGFLGYLYVQQEDLAAALQTLKVVEQWQSAHLSPSDRALAMTSKTIRAIEMVKTDDAELWV